MQTSTLNSSHGKDQLLHSKISVRLRAFRFLSKRYAQRERPSVIAEFALFAVIVLTATWPMFSMVHALHLLVR
jgi:hypothetical protein